MERISSANVVKSMELILRIFEKPDFKIFPAKKNFGGRINEDKCILLILEKNIKALLNYRSLKFGLYIFRWISDLSRLDL